jgi:FdhD protein
MTDAAVHMPSTKVTAQSVEVRDRCIPEEVPVAFVYDGSTYAVMMASPGDFEVFATGFSLSEGIVATPEEIQSLEIIRQPNGIELRMWLAPGRGKALAERRRRLAGPTGCGLCGVESLDAALPACTRVSSQTMVSAQDISTALATLAPAQALNQQTHAVHGAGFWTKDGGLLAVAEDVGRHNALDKLIGRLRRTGVDISGGVILLTSRVSVEMVQKAAASGAPILVAVSAPTALAVTSAQEAGITLVAVAREDAFEIFTHPHRITGAQLHRAKRKGAIDHAA